MKMLRNFLLWLALAGLGGQAVAGTDSDARGIAAGANNRALATPTLLMSMGKSGAICGQGNTTTNYVDAALVNLPANAIQGGSQIELYNQLARYYPQTAGWNYRWVLRQGSNTILLVNNTVDATLPSIVNEWKFTVSPDRRWGYAYSTNGLWSQSGSLSNGTGITGVAGLLPMPGYTGSSAVAVVNPNARTSSSRIAFASYSAAPTQETLLIDFSQPSTLALQLNLLNSNCAEVIGASATMYGPPASGGVANYASPKSTLVIGHSLVEGSGSIAVSNVPQDAVAVLRSLRPGSPIDNRGLAGQVDTQILTRFLADPIASQFWNVIWWGETNDFSTNPATWLAAGYAAIDRMLAVRVNQNTMIVNAHPNVSWQVGDANYTSMQTFNAAMLAKYGSNRIFDIFSVVATSSGKVPLGINANAAVTTGSITSGSNQLTVNSTTGMAVGQYVLSPGSSVVSDGTSYMAPYISAINGSVLTLLNYNGTAYTASASLSNAAISTVSPTEIHFNNAGYALIANAWSTWMTAHWGNTLSYVNDNDLAATRRRSA